MKVGAWKRRVAVAGTVVGTGLLLTIGLSRTPPGALEAAPLTGSAGVAGGGTGVGCMGRVEPASRVRRLAAPESQGVVTLAELAVREGERVERGQVLGWFSGRSSRAAAVRLAEAELRRSEARLAQVRAGAKSGEVAAAEARVARQRAAEVNARAELDRAMALAEKKVVADTELDSRRAAWAVAEAERRAAEQELASVAEVRRVDVAVAEAEVAQARAAEERAKAELDLAELRAPIDGTVLKIHTWPGEKIDERGVLDLGNLDEMHVVAEVYETDVARVAVGQQADVIVPGDAEALRGEVVDLGWQVRKRDVLSTDPVEEIDARVVEVRIRVNGDGARRLARFSNMRVQVVIGG
ncbi:HlyD family efflux transporter periplasmic adaptor subunit [Candidatus Binatia bacterium]|nr:HlyD family efflux transporter periplasmic adaptor subunit [Candidatus Binatia bacterium]